MISDKERELINNIIKLFIANKWCITSEGVAAFARQYGEQVDVEKVVAVMQYNTSKAVRR
jgi:hypothetical protein